MKELELARELVRSELISCESELSRWAAETVATEKRLEELRGLQERCQDRITRMSRVLSLLQDSVPTATGEHKEN